MFGHLYGFGSFLASPRGAMVASEFEVLSLVAHVEGEQSKGSTLRVFEEELENQDAFLISGCCFRLASAT